MPPPGRIDWGVRRSLGSLLRALLAAWIMAGVTGLAWLLAWRIDALWTGAQVVLVLHLVAGLAALALLLAFVPAHQACVDPPRWLLMPLRAWRGKGADDETLQRRRGYLLCWLALVTLGSGLWVLWPIAGWALGAPWAPEAASYDAMRWLHRAGAAAVMVAGVGHMAWRVAR